MLAVDIFRLNAVATYNDVLVYLTGAGVVRAFVLDQVIVGIRSAIRADLDFPTSPLPTAVESIGDSSA